MFMMIITMIGIPFLLVMLSMFFFKKSMFNLQLNLPFECGFNSLKSSRGPFSLQFFLLAILFLIFDVEITLLLPIPISLTSPSSLKTVSLFMFIMILLVGVMIEWYFKTLDWIK